MATTFTSDRRDARIYYARQNGQVVGVIRWNPTRKVWEAEDCMSQSIHYSFADAKATFEEN